MTSSPKHTDDVFSGTAPLFRAPYNKRVVEIVKICDSQFFDRLALSPQFYTNTLGGRAAGGEGDECAGDVGAGGALGGGDSLTHQ